jgi:hypothetical protein
MKTAVLAFVAASVAASSIASADILLDQRPSQATGSGRTVGFSTDFRVFQPFNVSDAAGWNVTSISLDGWNVQGSGEMTVDILADENSSPLASTSITFVNTDANVSDFRSGALNVNLSGNIQYILRARVTTAGDWNAIYLGSNGLGSFSRDNAGGNFAAGPIALYMEGTVLPTPGALAFMPLAALAIARRRR